MIQLEAFDNSHFKRGANWVVESLWIVARMLFFLIPIPIGSGLRVVLIRLFGGQVGRGVVVRSGVKIHFPWKVKIGNHVWIGENVEILSLDCVEVEDNVCISQGAFLCTGSHNFSSHSFDLITKPIHIEEGSWIAARVFIGPGVTIGRGTMCCAGSYIFKDIPAGSKVVGNPASVSSLKARVCVSDTSTEQTCGEADASY